MHNLNKTLLYTTLALAGACNVSKNAMDSPSENKTMPDVIPTSSANDQPQTTEPTDAVKKAQAYYDELNAIFTALKKKQEQFDAIVKDDTPLKEVEGTIITIQNDIEKHFVEAKTILKELEKFFCSSKNDNTPNGEVIQGYQDQLLTVKIWILKAGLAKMILLSNHCEKECSEKLQNANDQIDLLLENRELLLARELEVKQLIKDLKDHIEEANVVLLYYKANKKITKKVSKLKYQPHLEDLKNLKEQVTDLLETEEKKINARNNKLRELEEKLNKAKARTS